MKPAIPTPEARYASRLYAGGVVCGPGFSHTLGRQSTPTAHRESCMQISQRVAMNDTSVQLRNPGHRNALPLLNRQWMIRRLQFDERTDEPISEMDVSLQVHRVGVRLDCRIQPPEEGSDVGTLL